MKKLFQQTKKAIALTMAMLIWFSSVGFAADAHFCNQSLKSISLTGHAKSCHDSKSICKAHQYQHTTTHYMAYMLRVCSNATLVSSTFIARNTNDQPQNVNIFRHVTCSTAYQLVDTGADSTVQAWQSHIIQAWVAMQHHHRSHRPITDHREYLYTQNSTTMK